MSLDLDGSDSAFLGMAREVEARLLDSRIIYKILVNHRICQPTFNCTVMSTGAASAQSGCRDVNLCGANASPLCTSALALLQANSAWPSICG